MRLFYFLFFFITLCKVEHSLGQVVNYPVKDFINPLEIPLSLSGNFGELRSNHFHSGFDFKTNGKEGYRVMAVADGYVSRIKVSAWGYGNALYITHANGYVSVYGHLQRFDSIVSAYVKSRQYELESFEVDLFLKKNEISVKQGQNIAFSGNTGGSEGPHLHFEIRDGQTEEIINPYFFGFLIQDSVAPSIEGLAVYPIDSGSRINEQSKQVYLDIIKTDKDKYTLKEPLKLSGKIGFGIVTNDKESNNTNNNGTYQYELWVDSKSQFNYCCRRFSFDQTRYINAHIDYAKMINSKVKYQRCFILPGNKLKLYQSNNIGGVFDFNDTLKHQIQLKVSDYSNNSAILNFVSQSNTLPKISKVPVRENFFDYSKKNFFKTPDVQLEMPVNCIYESIYFEYKKTKGASKYFSDIHHIHNMETPIHSAYSLQIKVTQKVSGQTDKLLLARIDEKGNLSSEGGTFENGYVKAQIRNFGNFCIVMDTTAPTVKFMNYNKEKGMFTGKKITVKISDNLSGIQSYRGTIDGQWVLMEHDSKQKTLSYFFDERLNSEKKQHLFELVVKDRKGNIKKLKAHFN